MNGYDGDVCAGCGEPVDDELAELGWDTDEVFCSRACRRRYTGEPEPDEDGYNPACPGCGDRTSHEPWCLVGAQLAMAYAEDDHA